VKAGSTVARAVALLVGRLGQRVKYGVVAEKRSASKARQEQMHKHKRRRIGRTRQVGSGAGRRARGQGCGKGCVNCVRGAGG